MSKRVSRHRGRPAGSAAAGGCCLRRAGGRNRQAPPAGPDRARLGEGNSWPGCPAPPRYRPPILTASGVANISIDTVTNQICWSISVGGFDPTIALDSHDGAHPPGCGRASNGPVVVPLFPPLPTARPRPAASTDATYAPLIVANPAGFYVNVHNGHFPAGAIRGQLGERPAADRAPADPAAGL